MTKIFEEGPRTCIAARRTWLRHARMMPVLERARAGRSITPSPQSATHTEGAGAFHLVGKAAQQRHDAAHYDAGGRWGVGPAYLQSTRPGDCRAREHKHSHRRI